MLGAVPLFITLISFLFDNVLRHCNRFLAGSFKHKSNSLHLAGLLIRRGCDDDGSRLASALAVQMHWNLGRLHEQRVLDCCIDHLRLGLRAKHHTNRASNDAVDTEVDQIRKTRVTVKDAVRPINGQ